jgi:hypothetical protein
MVSADREGAMDEVVSCIVAMNGVEPSEAAQRPETNPIQPRRDGGSSAVSSIRLT